MICIPSTNARDLIDPLFSNSKTEHDKCSKRHVSSRRYTETSLGSNSDAHSLLLIAPDEMLSLINTSFILFIKIAAAAPAAQEKTA